MNELEFDFEEAPWERYLEALAPHSEIDAAELLTLLETEDARALEDALDLCRDRRILPRVTSLPKLYGSGDMALRLRTEEQWAQKGLNPGQMEHGDPLRIFLEEVAMTPAFGDSDLLAREAASGDEDAMAKLMNLSLRAILQTACGHTGHGVALMDLIQEGSIGLMQAVYDSGDFQDAANWWIRFFMARAIVLQAYEAGVGQKMRRDMEDYRTVDEQLLSELGRNPTAAEIAGAMHVSLETVQTLQSMVTIARKLRQALPEEKEAEELPQEEDQAVEDTAYFQTRQRVSDMLAGLTQQEAKVIALRFGLEGGLPLSPEDAGRKLGLTPDEVVAIEAAALNKMRNK